MKPEQRATFRALLAGELKVARAWALKERFRLFWEYTYLGAAQRFFGRWFWQATHSRLKPMAEVAWMIRRYLPNVLTYLRHRITNAGLEAVNATIQWVKRRPHEAFGTPRTSRRRSTSIAEGWTSTHTKAGRAELLLVGAMAALHMRVELRAARWQLEQSYPQRLTRGFELPSELRAPVDLDCPNRWKSSRSTLSAVLLLPFPRTASTSLRLITSMRSIRAGPAGSSRAPARPVGCAVVRAETVWIRHHGW
jgi:hypothetical protein